MGEEGICQWRRTNWADKEWRTNEMRDAAEGDKQVDTELNREPQDKEGKEEVEGEKHVELRDIK